LRQADDHRCTAPSIQPNRYRTIIRTESAVENPIDADGPWRDHVTAYAAVGVLINPTASKEDIQNSYNVFFGIDTCWHWHRCVK